MIAAEPSPPWAQRLTMPKGRCFIDTNVLVYADSTDEPRKQRIAIDVLRHLRFERLGVLSSVTEVTGQRWRARFTFLVGAVAGRGAGSHVEHSVFYGTDFTF